MVSEAGGAKKRSEPQKENHLNMGVWVTSSKNHMIRGGGGRNERREGRIAGFPIDAIEGEGGVRRGAEHR